MSEMTQTAPAVQQQQRVMLLPPWWTLQKKVAGTVGQDRGVQVEALKEVPGGYLLPVVTASKETGIGLATILRGAFPFGNVMVKLQVQDPDGNAYPARVIATADDLLAAVKEGLGTNALFVETFIGNQYPATYTQVVAVFTASVVQFWNDDLSDFYGNFNGVAADVFAEILTPDFGSLFRLATTTQNLQNS